MNRILFAFCALTLITPCYAKDVLGVQLDEVIRLSTGGKELKLNGTAVRMRAQHAVYVGGLYLEESMQSGNDVMDHDGAKRFVFNCRTDQISGERMVKAIESGIAINNDAKTLSAVKKHLEVFRAVWDIGVKKGDEIWFDYIPGRGTLIWINGEQQAEIAGEAFYAAFLSIWLGEHPVNLRMKQSLLGQ